MQLRSTEYCTNYRARTLYSSFMLYYNGCYSFLRRRSMMRLCWWHWIIMLVACWDYVLLLLYSTGSQIRRRLFLSAPHKISETFRLHGTMALVCFYSGQYYSVKCMKISLLAMKIVAILSVLLFYGVVCSLYCGHNSLYSRCRANHAPTIL